MSLVRAQALLTEVDSAAIQEASLPTFVRTQAAPASGNCSPRAVKSGLGRQGAVAEGVASFLLDIGDGCCAPRRATSITGSVASVVHPCAMVDARNGRSAGIYPDRRREGSVSVQLASSGCDAINEEGEP